MKQLSQVLENTLSSLATKEQSQDLSNTHQRGCISEAGSLITKNQNSVRPQEENLRRLALQSIEPLTKWKVTVGSDKQARDSLRDFIKVCFDALDTYGKTPDQLGNAAKLFIITMAEYPAQLVRIAFEKWVRTRNEMPTPAGIILIIEEDNSRLLDLLAHVRNGGGLADFAEEYVTSKLGKDWKNNV